MHSSMIGKILKAKRYAEERDRFTFTGFAVNVRGENEDHSVTFTDGKWHCNCHFFAGWGTCSHTMAMQRVLGIMLPADEALSASTDAAVMAG